MTLKPWSEVKVGDHIRITHGHHIEGVVDKDCASSGGKRMMFVICDGKRRLINYAVHRSVEVVE